MFTLHMLETWNALRADTQPTNDTVERLIGLLLKIRSRAMRSLVRPAKVAGFAHLPVKMQPGLMTYFWQNGSDYELGAVC